MKYIQTVNKSNITLNLVNFYTQNSPIFLNQKFKFFAQACSVICDLVQVESKIYKINSQEIQSEIGHCSCDSAKFKASAELSTRRI